jgi:hypothetical protein
LRGTQTRTLLLFTIWLVTASHVLAQGTPAILQCALNNGVDLHATRETSSPVVANVKCGDAIVLIDQQLSSPHIRTKDGKEGFIVARNLGQWSIQGASTPLGNTSTVAATTSAANSPPAEPFSRSTPRPPEQRIRLGTEEALNSARLFEVFWSPYSYSKWQQMDLHGGALQLAFRVTRMLSVVADVANHRSIGDAVRIAYGVPLNNERLEAWTYRFGPKFSIRPNERLTTFFHVTGGGTRIKAKYDFGYGINANAEGNGFSIAGGGGLDLAAKRWLGIRLVDSEYTYNRVQGVISHGVRLGGGLVFRIK